MSQERPTVTVVDDDDAVRRALGRLLSASGYAVRTFASAREVLAATALDGSGPGCLVLDVRMPDLDGLELQSILRAAGAGTAVVFMTAYGDVQTGVRAMKSGAVDFLLKPFSDDELLEAVGRALAVDAGMRAERHEVEELSRRAATLTRREREVCAHVVSGRLNKQIAAALGTSEMTVKVHRARVMAKMRATSLAELVRMTDHLDRARANADPRATPSVPPHPRQVDSPSPWPALRARCRRRVGFEP